MITVLLIRKPIRGSVAENVLAYKTGGLNLDACRITTTDKPKPIKPFTIKNVHKGYQRPGRSMYQHKTGWELPSKGRWPVRRRGAGTSG